MLETYVLCELLKGFWHNGENPRNLYFYRDSNKKEIDFILEGNIRLYPIEVKKTALPKAADFTNLNILDDSKKQVGKGAMICLCQEIMPIPKKNALFIPVWEIR